MMAEILDFNDAPTQVAKPITVALAYAARGWPVFPCNPLNKAPLLGRDVDERGIEIPNTGGLRKATTDAFQIRSWWGRWPQAMIGIPTGAASGFWVLDIDEGNGKTGVASLAEHGHTLAELMDTAVSTTASGGYHCLFRFDPAAPIGNSRGSLKRHLDVRGEGGYIIAAGSTRADGEGYNWLNPPDEIEIGDAPEWLLEAIGDSPKPGPPAAEFDFNDAGRRQGRELDDLVRGIVTGDTLHDNLVALSARMVGSNMHPGAVVSTLRGMMEAVPEQLRDARWRERFNDIPRTVASAEVKYAPAARAIEPEPRKPGQFRFRVTAYADIADTHHKTWLISNVLGAGEYSVIYGAPGCGKSVLMGDAAAHVAAGLPWFGRRVRAAVGVLYIAAERAGLVKRRLAAWRKRHGVLDLPIEVVEGIFDFCTGPLDLTEIVRIVQWMAEKYGVPVGWIIVDTKAQVMGAGDENSSREIGAFNANIARLQATGAHVTVVDHTPLHDPNRMRGSGALAGAADSSFLVKKEGGVRVLTIGSKAPNDGPDELEIVFGLESVVLGVDGEGEETKAPVVVPAELAAPESEPGIPDGAGLQQKILRLVTQAHANGQKLGFTSLKASTGSNQGSLSRALRKMTDAGHIIEVPIDGGAKLWTLP